VRKLELSNGRGVQNEVVGRVVEGQAQFSERERSALASAAYSSRGQPV